MKVGVVFPHAEIGTDIELIREYVRTVEELGFDHLLSHEHVLGVDPESDDLEASRDPREYNGPYHEPLTLFSHFAGMTSRVDFVTGVMILPQRQTALVAKQAAELDILSQGRLLLGVGVGWNPAEYRALGEDFSVRGRRIEEQVEILRALWEDEFVRFDGVYDTIPSVGLNPPPLQRPIPLLFGGSADPVLDRVARLGDGWLPLHDPGSELDEALRTIERYSREYGRDSDDLIIHGQMQVRLDEKEEWAAVAERWEEAGGTKVAVNAHRQGLTPEGHLEVLHEVAGVLDSRMLGKAR